MSRRKTESAVRVGLRMSIIETIPSGMIAMLLGGPLQMMYLSTVLGFSPFQLGLVNAITSFGLVAQIAIAFVMQRWRNRRLQVNLTGNGHRLLWVVTGLIPLLFPEQAWAPAYLVIWLFSQLLGQAYGVVWTSLIADIVPARLRGKFFGVRNMVYMSVICATLLVSGQFMQMYPGKTGFNFLFLISAVLIVWDIWAFLRHPNPPFQPSDSGVSLRMMLRPIQDRRFRKCILFIAVFLLLQGIVVPLYPHVIVNILDYEASVATAVVFVQYLVMIIGYYVWGMLSGKHSTRSLLLWTFPLIAASCIAWIGQLLFPAPFILVLAHALLGAGLSGYGLLVLNFLIEESPKSERPSYVAIFSALTGVAGVFGSIIGGGVYERAASAPLWWQSYGISAVAGTLMLLIALFVAPAVFLKKPDALDRKGSHPA